MAQPNKGSRIQVKARLPEDLAKKVAAAGEARGLTQMSDILADLVADALEQPRPSTYLPKPKRSKISDEQEAIFDKAS